MDPNVPGSSNPENNPSSDPFRRNPDGTLPADHPDANPAPTPAAPVVDEPAPKGKPKP